MGKIPAHVIYVVISAAVEKNICSNQKKLIYRSYNNAEYYTGVFVKCVKPIVLRDVVDNQVCQMS